MSSKNKGSIDFKNYIGEYQILKKIGEGSYAKIYKAKKGNSDTLYVLKNIPISEEDSSCMADLINESNILSKCDNEYILKYYDSFIYKGTFNIITEFCPYGDLFGYIKFYKDRKSKIEEKIVWQIFIQLSVGLNYLHSMKILHRDIKTKNVFIKDNLSIKIGDFGIAKLLNGTSSYAHTFIGTPYYISPELCKDLPYNDKSDVWALGVVLYELCTLNHPFEGVTQVEIYEKIMKGKFKDIPEIYSNDLKKMVDKLLDKNEHTRPRVIDILNMKLIKEKAKTLKIDLSEIVKDSNEYDKLNINIANNNSNNDINNRHSNASEINKKLVNNLLINSIADKNNNCANNIKQNKLEKHISEKQIKSSKLNSNKHNNNNNNKIIQKIKNQAKLIQIDITEKINMNMKKAMDKEDRKNEKQINSNTPKKQKEIKKDKKENIEIKNIVNKVNYDIASSSSSLSKNNNNNKYNLLNNYNKNQKKLNNNIKKELIITKKQKINNNLIKHPQEVKSKIKNNYDFTLEKIKPEFFSNSFTLEQNKEYVEIFFDECTDKKKSKNIIIDENLKLQKLYEDKKAEIDHYENEMKKISDKIYVNVIQIYRSIEKNIEFDIELITDKIQDYINQNLPKELNDLENKDELIKIFKKSLFNYIYYEIELENIENQMKKRKIDIAMIKNKKINLTKVTDKSGNKSNFNFYSLASLKNRFSLLKRSKTAEVKM